MGVRLWALGNRAVNCCGHEGHDVLKLSGADEPREHLSEPERAIVEGTDPVGQPGRVSRPDQEALVEVLHPGRGYRRQGKVQVGEGLAGGQRHGVGKGLAGEAPKAGRQLGDDDLVGVGRQVAQGVIAVGIGGRGHVRAGARPRGRDRDVGHAGAGRRLAGVHRIDRLEDQPRQGGARDGARLELFHRRPNAPPNYSRSVCCTRHGDCLSGGTKGAE